MTAMLKLVKVWKSINYFEFFDHLLFDFVGILGLVVGVDNILQLCVVVDLDSTDLYFVYSEID